MPYDLPQDLIVKIFSRLPAISVLRFRSVSKSLRACIDSPRFTRLHTLQSPKRVTIIYKTRSDKLIYTLLPENQLSYNHYIGVTAINYPFQSVDIVGTCNGILCVYESNNHKFHLWNPSIRRKVVVRDLCSSLDDVLAHGFGFDSTIDDYKILKITNRVSFVYTLKTQTWRQIPSPTTRFSDVKPQACIFNGALHWVVNSRDSHSYIMTFDLSSEVFSAIGLLRPVWETNVVTTIKGSLAVITLNHQRRDPNPNKGVTRAFERVTNGDLLFKNALGVQAYDLVKKEPRILHILPGRSVVEMNVCDESLELLDMGTSCDQGNYQVKKKRSKIYNYNSS